MTVPSVEAVVARFPGGSPDRSAMPVQRVVWRPSPAPCALSRNSNEVAGKRVLVIGGPEEASSQVAASLARLGGIVSRYSAANLADVDCRRVDGVIDLNPLHPFTSGREGAWKELLKQTVTVLKSVYPHWLEADDASRIFYMPVTTMDGQMAYGGGVIVQPLGGIWAGLAKTLPREIPNCNVKVLDLSSGPAPDR